MRLFVLLLAAMSAIGVDKAELDQVNLKSGSSLRSNPGGLRDRPFSLQGLRYFLDQADGQCCNQAFKVAVSWIGDCALLNLNFWLSEANVELRLLTIATVVFGQPVGENSQIGPMTVGQLIEQGLVLIHPSENRLILPYPYLYLVERSTSQPLLGRSLSLHNTPTRCLSPEQAETLDLSILLFRFDLYRVLGKSTCTLYDLGLCVESCPNVCFQVPTSKITINRPTGEGSRITIQNVSLLAALLEMNQATTNGLQAPAFDSAIPLRVAKTQRVDQAYYVWHGAEGDPVATKAAARMTQIVFSEVNFLKGGVIEKNKQNHDRFAIFVQSKRKTRVKPERPRVTRVRQVKAPAGGQSLAAPLTAIDIWEEYFKVREFIHTVPFLLVIVTDGVASPVPEPLKYVVTVVDNDRLDTFYGPGLAKRRKESSSK